MATQFETITEPTSASQADRWVTLIDGSRKNLRPLSCVELMDLQWEQEPAFAQRIAQSPKGSIERQQTIAWAYETVCSILQEFDARDAQGESFSMGMDRRYIDLVIRTLQTQHQQGLDGGFFELGFGSGILLQAVARAGFTIGGLEVAESLFAETKSQLDHHDTSRLAFGNFLQLDMNQHAERYSVAYWNDVFEHVPVDEIADYLGQLHRVLQPGGKLITITPNWHMRPSDITATHRPARTEAMGFHLKEYTLREVHDLLKSAGFQRVETPTWIGRRKIHTTDGWNLTQLKLRLEPALEWLPFRVAVQVCRRFGFNCTIATRG